MGPQAPYPLQQALRLTGLTKTFLLALAEQGVIRPREGQCFTHQDVVVLRTAKALRDAGMSPRKVIQALRRMQGEQAPQPLSGVRLRAHAGAIEARTRDRQRIDARTGQALLAFDDEPEAGGVQLLAPAVDAGQRLHQALLLEASDSAAAEAAYRQALAQDAGCAAAYVNLGALLCESRRFAEAVALYDQALEFCGATALVHFNRATALEEVNQPWQAVFAYKRALELQPALADAHYNLGLLLERLGDRQGSLRHLSAYRRERP